MSNTLFEARIQLFDGSVAKGPVTTDEKGEYLFRNIFSELDLYFCLKKDGYKWNFSGGPSIEIPFDYIRQVGRQIDLFHNPPEIIEQMADGILPRFISDSNLQSLHFEFAMLPNTLIRAYYAKIQVDGGLYWRMQRFEFID
jgi:hypothetical protein